MESINLRGMLDHLLMPRKISLNFSEEVEYGLIAKLAEFLNQENESDLLRQMLINLSSLNQSPPTVDQLAHLLQAEEFLVAVPLLGHNTVILFNGVNHPAKDGKKNVLLSAFDVVPHKESLHSKSADKKPFPSDCRLAVPRCSILVPLEQVTSKVFLEQIVQLGNKWEFPGRDPKARKAGHEVTETRKPANPTYIFDWLLATLVESDHRPDPTQSVLVKRIRLELIRKNKQTKPWHRSWLWIAVKSAFHLSIEQITGNSSKYKTTMARFQAAMIRRALEMHQLDKSCYDFGEMREMAAYLARKSEKLHQHSQSEVSDAINDLRETCETIDKVLSAEWSLFLESERDKNKINIGEIGALDFTSDICNPFSNARPFLQSALGTDTLLSTMRSSSQTPNLPNVASHLSITNNNPSEDQVLIAIETLIDRIKTKKALELESTLQSAECFIRHLWTQRDQLTRFDSIELMVENVYKFFVTYQSVAHSRYNGDAIRLGKWILYSFTLVAWMDHACVLWDPLEIFEIGRAHV
jgi:hypothetical protein